MTLQAEWVSAIAETVTALAVVFAYLQLRETHKQVIADHERSRREGAVHYILTWTNNTSRPMSSASRVVDGLDFETCKMLVDRREITVRASNRDLLMACFPPGVEFGADGANITLNVQQSAEIRTLVIKQLNLLETVLCAWRHGSVRRDIIEEEFNFLLEPKEGNKLLKNFREATGDHKYPAIAAFELHMAKEREKLKQKGEDDYLYPSAPQR
jgi:hypothetical protein